MSLTGDREDHRGRMQSDRDQQRWLAIHEAGHAVIGVLEGCDLVRATCQPDWDAGTLGACVFGDGYRPSNPFAEASEVAALPPVDRDRWLRRLEREIRVTMAGPLAQARFEGAERWLTPEWAGDVPDVMVLLMTAWAAGEQGARLERFAAEVRVLLTRSEVWAAVLAVADALEAQPIVTGDEVRAIVRGYVTELSN